MNTDSSLQNILPDLVVFTCMYMHPWEAFSIVFSVFYIVSYCTRTCATWFFHPLGLRELFPCLILTVATVSQISFQILTCMIYFHPYSNLWKWILLPSFPQMEKPKQREVKKHAFIVTQLVGGVELKIVAPNILNYTWPKLSWGKTSSAPIAGIFKWILSKCNAMN